GTSRDSPWVIRRFRPHLAFALSEGLDQCRLPNQMGGFDNRALVVSWIVALEEARGRRRKAESAGHRPATLDFQLESIPQSHSRRRFSDLAIRRICKNLPQMQRNTITRRNHRLWRKF